MAVSRICHITTAHTRNDVRIFLKELTSLSNRFECHFIVADDQGNERKNNISIWDIGKSQGRLGRAVKVVQRAYKKALKLNCDIYHFHDPEFILAALMLKIKGKKVIYDIHEDVPRDILSKEYLGSFRKPVSFLFEQLENFCARRLSCLITATPHIRDRFKKLNLTTIDINNYPLLKDYSPDEANLEFDDRNNIVYIGAISKIRGITELVNSLSLANTRLELAGNFDTATFQKYLQRLDGWKSVNYYGLLDRKKVRALLQSSIAGIVTFYPEPNHIHAQPNKIFEYMSAGLPVICSNFVSWQEIIEKNKCGLLVDPMNPAEISAAVKWLLTNKDQAKQMALNGMVAIKSQYNWEIEQNKLLGVYQELINQVK